MKLLACHNCSEIFSLSFDNKYCKCKNVSGKYVSSNKAAINGTKGTFSVIGFNNTSFINAIKKQIKLGNLPNGSGREFIAFVLPDGIDSVEYD